jgi:Zn-dependent protease with chaperone function
MPWRDVQRRAGGGVYRLLVAESGEVNACAPFGRTVAVTSHAARSLPPNRLAGVLAHELGHSLGWRAGPAFVRAQVTVPGRALSWTLRAPWSLVVSLWKRAVAWHRPIGFLLVFVMALVATAVSVVVVVPAVVAQAGVLAGRVFARRAEARADAAAVRMGLGPELVAAVEHHIDGADPARRMPVPLIRRAEGLRRALG